MAKDSYLLKGFRLGVNLQSLNQIIILLEKLMPVILIFDSLPPHLLLLVTTRNGVDGLSSVSTIILFWKIFIRFGVMW